MTTTPPPPTNAERVAAAQWTATQTATPKGDTPIVLLVVVGALLLGGAFVAYLRAQHSIALDNPYMRGDQAHAANYGPAIFLAAAGAFVLLLAAIMGSSHRR